jgi:hypothetical protein
MLRTIVVPGDALGALETEDPELAVRYVKQLYLLCCRHGVVCCPEQEFAKLEETLSAFPLAVREQALALCKLLKYKLGESRWISVPDECDVPDSVEMASTTNVQGRRYSVQHLHLAEGIAAVTNLGTSSQSKMRSARDRDAYWEAWLRPLIRRYITVRVFDRYALTAESQSALAWLIGMTISEGDSWCAGGGPSFEFEVYCERGRAASDSGSRRNQLDYEFDQEAFRNEILSHSRVQRAGANVRFFRAKDWRALRFPSPTKAEEAGAIRNMHNRYIRFSGGCRTSCAVTMEEGLSGLVPEGRLWRQHVNHHYLAGPDEMKPLEALETTVCNSKSTDKSLIVGLTAV